MDGWTDDRSMQLRCGNSANNEKKPYHASVWTFHRHTCTREFSRGTTSMICFFTSWHVHVYIYAHALTFILSLAKADRGWLVVCYSNKTRRFNVPSFSLFPLSFYRESRIPRGWNIYIYIYIYHPTISIVGDSRRKTRCNSARIAICFIGRAIKKKMICAVKRCCFIRGTCIIDFSKMDLSIDILAQIQLLQKH